MLSAENKKKLYLDEVFSTNKIVFEVVKCFFAYKGRYIVCVDEKDTYSKIFFKNRYLESYLSLWDKWDEVSSQKPIPKVFEYPAQLLFKETREVVNLDVFIKIGLLIVLLLLAFSPVNLSSLEMFFLLLFLSGPLLLDTFTMRFSKRFFNIMILNGSILRVNFINGHSREFSIDEIKRYFFEPKAKNAHMVLSDGTVLQHLERVSHWPVLRKHLLSKLESTTSK